MYIVVVAENYLRGCRTSVASTLIFCSCMHCLTLQKLSVFFESFNTHACSQEGVLLCVAPYAMPDTHTFALQSMLCKYVQLHIACRLQLCTQITSHTAASKACYNGSHCKATRPKSPGSKKNSDNQCDAYLDMAASVAELLQHQLLHSNVDHPVHELHH